MRTAVTILLLAIGLTVVLYAPGLNGPFLFDDHVHITQNRWVKIESLAPADLAQAWHSSFSAFPSNRPLAQLSFGINHALAGLDPWAFKATNLAIHLLTGVMVFVFVRLCARAVGGTPHDEQRAALIAAATAAAWLLHPLQVSTVLYTVQRMAQLSSLGLLVALSLYLHGRLRLAAGGRGIAWMLAAAPVAALAFLAKENAALLPLLLLVVEITLLRSLPLGARPGLIRAIQLLYIALPLLAAGVYLASHPQLITYEGRTFTLDERLLTQPRVLWFYLRLLLVPDLSAFGLFHDDFVLSSGWMEPWTTLPAILGLAGLFAAALWWRRRAPVFAFAVLFFLANHLLESTIIPLEMVFEHRNYLASVAPLMLIAWSIGHVAMPLRLRRAAVLLGVLLLTAYLVIAGLRIGHWTSYQAVVLNNVERHPRSLRANFMAAQALIATFGNAQPGIDTSALAGAARQFLDNGLDIDPGCLDCRFGHVILDLQLGRDPEPASLTALVDGLRHGHVGPTRIAVSQFSFLARWHRSDGHKLPPGEVEAIFQAALANPGWNATGRAGVAAAYREYLEFVTGDLAAAERQARAAVAAWPQQWGYHVQLVNLLRKRGDAGAARRALLAAANAPRNALQRGEFVALEGAIQRELTGTGPQGHE